MAKKHIEHLSCKKRNSKKGENIAITLTYMFACTIAKHKTKTKSVCCKSNLLLNCLVLLNISKVSYALMFTSSVCRYLGSSKFRGSTASNKEFPIIHHHIL